MNTNSLDKIYANPCVNCYVCDFKRDDPKCYKGNPAQCSVCAVIQIIIEICRVECAKIELKASREAVKSLHNRLFAEFKMLDRIQPAYEGSRDIDVRELQKVLCDFEDELQGDIK